MTLPTYDRTLASDRPKAELGLYLLEGGGSRDGGLRAF